MHLSDPEKRTSPLGIFARGSVPSSYPEQPFHKGAVQVPEIEDGLEATIIFGDEEVVTVAA